MPKIYSEKEREQIVKRLKEEANLLMQEKGVKKTTVDELVKRVGIPKGTFYLFYPSKEMLLFDVSQDFHAVVDSYISEGILKIAKDKKIALTEDADFSGCVEELTDVILGAMNITYNSCLKVLFEPEAMNLVLSKLPEEVLSKHLQEDRGMGEGIIESLALRKGLDVEAITGAFMMILFGGMYKRGVGEENFEKCMRTMIRGIVMQIVM